MQRKFKIHAARKTNSCSVNLHFMYVGQKEVQNIFTTKPW